MAELFDKNDLVLYVIYHKRKKEWYRGGEKFFFGTNYINNAKFYTNEGSAIYAIKKLTENGYNGQDTMDDYCLVKYKAVVEEIAEARDVNENS